MTPLHGQNDPPASERIAKAIARAGLCSRREAETWIAAGRVAINGEVVASPARNVTLADRISVDGVRYGPIEATLDRAQGSNVWLTFAMREGKNREVKNVLGHLGLKVNRLIRLSFGPFQLGELAPGAIVEVKTRTLRDQLGERIAALAGADFSGPIGEREAASAAGAPEAQPERGGAKRKRRRFDPDRIGGPELARRDKR